MAKRKGKKLKEEPKKRPNLAAVPETVLAKLKERPNAPQAVPFRIPRPLPGVLPDRETGLAMDENPQITAAINGAANYYGRAFTEGLEFLGYPYLAELSQRPEYRVIVEVIATEMTRKWIKLRATGDRSKTRKIARIEAEEKRLNVRDSFRRILEQEGFYGRSHLYIDTGSTDDLDELLTPIGDGRNDLSKKKIRKGGIQAFRPVEAVWTYPTNYNSNDPLKGDWYKPDVWFVMGKRIHSSRLLTVIGREVPDLLKPAYSFGGLALTQMVKPYVDNWLETRQSVNDIVSAFSTFVLSTSMEESLQIGGDGGVKRAMAFNAMRDNRGLMMIDKTNEEFGNVSAPLGSLDLLQAQAQEHMASVSRIPLVKLLGITPSGLNASSDGEIRCFYDTIASMQEQMLREPLTTVLGFIQLSLFGSVDEEITFEFEPLWALSEKEKAEVDKIEAETAQVRIDSGVIAPDEERRRVASQPDTPYDGLDPEDAPDLREEEEEGLEPRGGRSETALDAMFDRARKAA